MNKGRMCVKILGLNCAHLEWAGLIIMAWDGLSSEEVQIQALRVTALQPMSSNIFLIPKDVIIYGVPNISQS